MMNALFTERFRPKTLNQIILPKRIRDELGTGDLSKNYLFYGTQGTGKTSLAKILATDRPTLYINVSDESSVDIVRTKIHDFCSTISVLDNSERLKVVILDELDGASDQFYKALRGTIEKFAAQARFIGTCNYINKVPDAITSRFGGGISFDYVSKEEEKEIKIAYIKRCLQIFKKLEIEISSDAVVEFVKRNFPDFRLMVDKIQSFHDKKIKKIEIEDIKTLNYTFSDVFDLLLNKVDPVENYKMLMSNYAMKVDEVLASLGTELPTYLREHKPEKIKFIPGIIIEVAAHQAQRTQVIDPAVSMLSCAYKIQNIINGW